MEFLLDDEDCRIVHESGNNRMAIVSFAGVGYALGGIQVEEFRQSLDGSRCDIYFVIDKRRHWYNGIYESVAPVLNASLRARGIEASFTLGNSMGGFAAVAFAGILHRCVRAIAFCPQSSVSPACTPFEDRWQEWTRTIVQWQIPDAAAEMTETIDYALFFGALDPRDLAHAARFAAAPGQKLICVVDRCAHDVAKHLKSRGVLIPLLGGLLSPGPVDRHALAALMSGIPYTLLTERMALDRS